MTSPFVAPDRDARPLYHIYNSPIGRLLLLGDGHALTGLWMIDAERHNDRDFGAGLTPRPDTEDSFHVKDPDGFDVQISGPNMKP